MSSPRAAAKTLTTRSAAAAAKTEREADKLGFPVVRDSADTDALEGLDAAPGADTAEEEQQTLVTGDRRLLELAERARALEGPQKDTKLKLLIKQLKELLAEAGPAGRPWSVR